MDSKIINLIPDVTVISSIILAYFLDRNFPIIKIVPPPISLIGWLMVATGIILALYAISIIRLRNASSNVTEVPSALVTKGIYSLSRNPFYFSYVIITIGAALILGSLTAFSGPIICITVLHQIIIPFEEKKLQEALGQKYKQYKYLVRRWI
jgi:protein-S-isoprenylcysteine O-methyltransferase Ste14